MENVERTARDAPAVVLAPGLLCDARLWDSVRARLGAASRTVEFTDDPTLDAMADRILREAPPRFVLAGFSMGGMAAVLAAARAPERISGLLILSTHGDVDTPQRRAARCDQLARSRREPFETFVAREIVGGTFPETGPCAQAAKLVETMALDQGRDVFQRHVQALIDRPDIGEAARGASMPAVVLTGAKDTVALPPAAARLAAKMPCAKVRVVPRCGHMLPLEQPDVVAEVLTALVASASLESAAA
jgi:pimeloyl-ACP methyl ester carboxylesterase